ncbi:MAG: YqiA/YcfP family alpha/beta fold hydrolase [Cyanobacteria bacterium P01_H01_bin.121]
MRYIYLHGFASSPNSAKAKYFRDRFASRHLRLELPDLNQPNFFELTVTRQIQQVTHLIQRDTQPVTLIGSSLGGLTAAWVAESELQVQQLLLLAPAFNFLRHWRSHLGADQLHQWQTTGSMAVYHYGYQRSCSLSYQFWQDCQPYCALTPVNSGPRQPLQRPVPTHIIHGQRDAVIPIQASRDYLGINTDNPRGQRPWVKLIELDSDHTLGNVVSKIWQYMQAELLL